MSYYDVSFPPLPFKFAIFRSNLVAKERRRPPPSTGGGLPPYCRADQSPAPSIPRRQIATP